MNKLIAALVVLVALAVPAGASAQQYVLKHPKHEHCRAHYVRKVDRQETLCVELIPTFTLVTAERVVGGVGEKLVSGEVGLVSGNGRALVGVPITYAVVDESTGARLASFTAVSNPVHPCTLVLGIPNELETTFAGESVAPYAGCGFAAVSVPTGQLAVLTGSFAGNATYAPSTGEATL
jgi:hypothetical protein